MGIPGAPPIAQKFLNFMQFLGKFGKILCWCSPPGGLVPLLHTLQEHQKIRTNARAGNDSDLLRVPLLAAMFVVTRRNQNFSKVFPDI